MKMLRLLTLLSVLVLAAPLQAQDPDIRVCEPAVFTAQYNEAIGVSRVLDLSLCYGSGNDSAPPARLRYKLVEARLEPSGIWLTSQYMVDQYGSDLIAFDSEGWSGWIGWADAEVPAHLRLKIPRAVTPEGDRVYYLLAVQVEDANGSQSTELRYSREVQNFFVNTTATPALTVREAYFGEHVFSGLHGQWTDDIAQGQELRFAWFASADSYGGTIAFYRWGWDIQDPDDPNDPGWAVLPGLDPEHTTAPVQTFTSGIHVLTVVCSDLADQRTLARWMVNVVPVPDLPDQLPVLLIDDVPDHLSLAWPDQVGNPTDTDARRDEFWATVLGAVAGWHEQRDVIDTQESLDWGYREAVNYRSLVWITRSGQNTYINNRFVSSPGATNYVWLEPYMERVGNLFLSGSGAAQGFEPDGANGLAWLYPIIYDTAESYTQCGNTPMALGLGTRAEAGDYLNLGTETVPYRSLGLAMLNLMVPPRFFISPAFCGWGGVELNRRCAGAKGLRLDPTFAYHHDWADAIADTIMTSAVMDHADSPDNLLGNWAFGATDEFYDTNITTRTTQWSPQLMPGEWWVIEPMWRAITRYDWIRDHHLAAGDDDFPGDIDVGSQSVCGRWTIDPQTDRTRMDGVPLGVLSNKTIATKPTGRPDILWGFDPYRFDHEAMTRAIRLVLAGNFGLEVDGLVANEDGQDDEQLPPSVTALHPCRPNPFNPSTTLSFDLVRPGAVSLRVVDVRGRHVAQLLDESLPLGFHEARWKGRDDAGRDVPAGVYFAQLITDEARETRRMVLLK